MFLSNRVSTRRRSLKTSKDARRRKPASFRLDVELLERRDVPTVIFQPVLGAQTLYYDGKEATSPLAANPYALKSPTVDLIFWGPDWQDASGKPVAAVDRIIKDAQTILGSAYLSGLTDYGSDGKAKFGAYYVDPSVPGSQTDATTGKPFTKPETFEVPLVSKVLNLPTSPFSPPKSGSVVDSPIYAVIRDNLDLYQGGGSNHGDGAYTDSKGADTGLRFNYVDISLNSADEYGNFDRVFAHEIAERMSQGAAAYDTSGFKVLPNGQVADGEPDVNYSAPLNSSLFVPPYWSLSANAYVVPDGSPQNVVLQPIWNGSSFSRECISLQQNNLYEITMRGSTTLIDSQVSAYALYSSRYSLIPTNLVFDMTLSGQVRVYNETQRSWTAVTGSNTRASKLVAANGSLYMLASNDGGPEQVWQYSGSGTSWTAVTGTDTKVAQIAVARGELLDRDALYMLASNDGVHNQVWLYSGSGTSWSSVTGPNTNVRQIAVGRDRLYMLANNDDFFLGHDQVWKFITAFVGWEPVTGTTTNVSKIVSAANQLYMLANNGDVLFGHNQVWHYSGADTNWDAVTGMETTVFGLTGTGDSLYMLAANGGQIAQVWHYDGSPNVWTPLTGLRTKVLQIVTAGNGLYMLANGDGVHNQVWLYSGSGTKWAAVTRPSTKVTNISAPGDYVLMFASMAGDPFHTWRYDGGDVWTLVS